MVGLPTETLEDIIGLGDLIIDCGFCNFLCNYYGYSPKHPLSIYEQLSDGVKEMHLAYLIRYIKKNFDTKFEATYYLHMQHESIEDRSKRSVVRALEKLKENQQYSHARLLRITNEYFCGNDVSVRSKKETVLTSDEIEKEYDRIILQKKRCS